jgi:hypothetical protein
MVYLQGEVRHKNLWLLELDAWAARQLTIFPPTSTFGILTSRRMAVKWYSNGCRNIRMWCWRLCPGHNRFNLYGRDVGVLQTPASEGGLSSSVLKTRHF